MRQAFDSKRVVPFILWSAVIIAALEVGQFISEGSTTSIFLLIGVASAMIMLFQSIRTWAYFLIIAFTAPGIIGFGSGLYPGLNLETLFVLVLIIFLSLRYLFLGQRPVGTDAIGPFSVFILVQFLSYLNGSLTSPYSGLSVIGAGRVIRDLIAPWCLYYFVIFINMSDREVRRLWASFIGICLLCAAIQAGNVVFNYAFDSNQDWFSVRLANVDLGFFQVFQIVYLLPFNLMIANLVYSRSRGLARNIRIALIVVFFVASISVLQRAIVVCIIVSLLSWLLVRVRRGFKHSIAMATGILAILIILSPIGKNLSEQARYTFDAGPRGSEIGGISIHTSGRLEKQWPMAIAYFKERPVTGIGFREIGIRTWFGASPIKGGISAHSLYLGWLAESGIIGFLVGVWFFYRMTKSLRRAMRSNFGTQNTHEIATGLFVFWISFMVNAIINEFFWVSTWLFGFMMLLAACQGLISRRELVNNSASKPI